MIHAGGATEGLLAGLAAFRSRLAGLAGLGWASGGAIDLAVPAGLVQNCVTVATTGVQGRRML